MVVRTNVDACVSRTCVVSGPNLTVDFFLPFSEGCGTTGDGVSDTNREREPAYGCPIGRDTCPDSVGSDPVQNYMDYTDDSCLSSFTAGQYNRMIANWNAYRTAGTKSVAISITHDNTPRETAWTLSQASTNYVLYRQARGAVTSPRKVITQKFFLNPGTYRFYISDSGNNGICCGKGRGSYSIIVAGRVVRSGGTFGNVQSVEFTVQ
jgi:Pregnancy-associated plasma protein-A